MPALPIETFKLERYFARYEFATRYLLGSSDCESVTVAELLALEPGAEEGFKNVWLGYTESRGAPELRAAIAELYTSIEPEHVLVHTGAEEAIYAFVRAILSTGEHVVVQTPCYQSLLSVARHQGCEVAVWRPAADPQWRWSLDELETLVKPNTQAVVINSPHNPTGYQMSDDEFRQVVRIAEDRGATLFSDEVYRLSELDVPTLPAACDLSERAVSLGVLSKSFGLPGLRIGWLASRNTALLEQVAAYKDYLSMCTSAPSEFLSALALRRRAPILERERNLLRRNRDLLRTFFDRHRDFFACALPTAGPIAFPRLAGERSAEALCAEAIRQGVMLVPSSQFDYGDRHVRIGYGRKNFPEALDRFERVVQALAA
jgi:aspartate/methionine/tyrosine aminotransferase